MRTFFTSSSRPAGRARDPNTRAVGWSAPLGRQRKTTVEHARTNTAERTSDAGRSRTSATPVSAPSPRWSRRIKAEPIAVNPAPRRSRQVRTLHTDGHCEYVVTVAGSVTGVDRDRPGHGRLRIAGMEACGHVTAGPRVAHSMHIAPANNHNYPQTTGPISAGQRRFRR